MFSQSQHHSLTRRGSKLLVEVVIGVIGVLGIMLAHVGEHRQAADFHGGNISGESISIEVSKVAPRINWSEVFFN